MSEELQFKRGDKVSHIAPVKAPHKKPIMIVQSSNDQTTEVEYWSQLEEKYIRQTFDNDMLVIRPKIRNLPDPGFY